MKVLLVFFFGPVCLIGLAIFFNGFRRFRDYKINADTPEIPIGSVALGLVKIRGRAECDELVPAPFSRTLCCFYRTEIIFAQVDEHNRESHGASGFQADGPRFFLVDPTGKVVIDAHKAYKPSTDPDRPLGRALSLLAPFKIWYDAMEESEWEEDYGLHKTFDADVGTDEPGIEKITGRKLDTQDLAIIDNHLQTHFQDKGAENPTPKGEGKKESYGITEWCVLPGVEYLVIGDCIENPDSRGLEDRNLVCARKGMPFVISRDYKGDAHYQQMHSAAVATIIVGGGLFLMGVFFLVVFLFSD
jgi:hypothetical protein